VIPTLRTERLVLRPFTDADRPAWAAMHADPAVMATLGPVLDRAGTDALLDRVVARWDELGYGWWCVDLAGECIGTAGLGTPTWDAPFTIAAREASGRPVVELAWRIASTHWGFGYAPEAAAAAVTYGFDTLGVPELVAFTAETNTKSRRVMVKLGMTHDAAGDFDHPNLAAGDPLRRHVLYRLRRPSG
jgi:ribosomal-protein-alanine N-acetyltransferase